MQELSLRVVGSTTQWEDVENSILTGPGSVFPYYGYCYGLLEFCDYLKIPSGPMEATKIYFSLRKEVGRIVTLSAREKQIRAFPPVQNGFAYF